MSKFSGKCDFYDWFSMLTEHPSDTNEYILVSDDNDNFKKFRELTGGYIYQEFPMKLTRNNIEAELKTNKMLKKNEDGTYTYFFQNYKSYKNIKHYYARKKIHIERLIDLVPYFPYLISIASYNSKEAFILIMQRPYTDIEYEELRECGYESPMNKYYKKTLSDYYLELSQNEVSKKVQKPN